MCNFHFISMALLTFIRSDMKAGPLSDPMLVGNPNRGTISLSRLQATSDALSVQVGRPPPMPRMYIPRPTGNENGNMVSSQ